MAIANLQQAARQFVAVSEPAPSDVSGNPHQKKLMSIDQHAKAHEKALRER